MARKKKEEQNEKASTKKVSDEIIPSEKNVEKFSIYVLLENHNIKPLDAVGFLEYYGLVENFAKEMAEGDAVVEFTEEEFNDMYERYIKREI